MEQQLDRLVVGAGLHGLRAALSARAAGRTALCVEALPWPGGAVRTLRSEGYVLELGPFAMARDELAGWLLPLRQPPHVVAAQSAHGQRHDGTQLLAVPLDPAPVAPAAGFEALTQAYRRELGPALRLGRRVVAVRPDDAGDGFAVALEGAGDPLHAAAVDLCVGRDAAAQLLAPFDHRLAELLPRLRREPRAFVFLGADAVATAHWRGFGILPADAAPVVEVLFATNAFAGRAQRGKALARLECCGDAVAPDDATLVERAERQLERLSGAPTRIAFRRVHRVAPLVRDACWVEIGARLHGVCSRLPGLAVPA